MYTGFRGAHSDRPSKHSVGELRSPGNHRLCNTFVAAPGPQRGQTTSAPTTSLSSPGIKKSGCPRRPTPEWTGIADKGMVKRNPLQMEACHLETAEWEHKWLRT